VVCAVGRIPSANVGAFIEARLVVPVPLARIREVLPAGLRPDTTRKTYQVAITGSRYMIDGHTAALRQYEASQARAEALQNEMRIKWEKSK
jgi:hypothetical protein